MQAYPIKFTPILKDKIWGGKKLNQILNKDQASDTCGESWELSSVEGNVSVVSNGLLKGNDLNELLEIYMADLVGEKNYEQFGNEFPLLFKFIDASDVLSIQVHPDNDLAKERHNAYGKTEMWYVLNADDNSELINGFNTKLDKKKYLDAFKNGQLSSLLNRINTKANDAFFIPAGRVHAIGKGNLLAEIQQTSDVTYRIYDWDRKDNEGNGRELHTDLAVDALDYKHYDSYQINYQKTENESSNLVDSEFFTCNILNLTRSIETDYSMLDSFIVYMCVEGKVKIEIEGANSEMITVGETILIPAIAEKLTISPVLDSKVLEIFIKPVN